MSEIPYYFDTPVPKYFRENGWFECEHMFKFVHWAFAKCQNIPHKKVIQGRELLLQPFEFIAGRLSSPKECFLSENVFRNQLLKLERGGILKKTTNSLTNKYTCYVWLIEAFCKNINQQNNQQSTNSQPTVNHKSRRKKSISKESHPSIPSVDQDLDETDDFPSEIEILPGIFLSQIHLDACVKIKGDIEKVKDSIKFIQESPKRKHPISDWPNALAKWKIEHKNKLNIQDHIDYAEKLCKLLPNFETKKGWKCSIYHDKKKDQKGLLFEPQSVYVDPVFIAFIDPEFLKKSRDEVVSKGLNKKPIPEQKIVGING